MSCILYSVCTVVYLLKSCKLRATSDGLGLAFELLRSTSQMYTLGQVLYGLQVLWFNLLSLLEAIIVSLFLSLSAYKQSFSLYFLIQIRRLIQCVKKSLFHSLNSKGTMKQRLPEDPFSVSKEHRQQNQQIYCVKPLLISMPLSVFSMQRRS